MALSPFRAACGRGYQHASADFLEPGGTLPFLKGDRLPRSRLWLLIAMTSFGVKIRFA